jgi:predicted dehydrogenase
MLSIGVIGYGYWGPNIVRNFCAVEGARVLSVCDINPHSKDRAKKQYPHLNFCHDYREIAASPEINAVAVVTPVSTHFEISKNALENGKHLFVEKPFTRTVGEAEDLIALASKNNLKIMVDHTFLFTGAVRKIKELIDKNTLGNLYYYDSIRVNLGLFQHDVNVIWDLAPHDLSIMDYVIKEKPIAVAANGAEHFGSGLEDVAYVTVYFEDNMIAHLDVNWMSPVKIRMTLIGGEKKMLVWDDAEVDEKIKVYDKGVNVQTKEGIYRLLVDYRSGDAWVPRLDRTEALRLETEYFIDCILGDKTPINDGHAGLRVIKMLEAASKSIKNKGRLIEL